MRKILVVSILVAALDLSSFAQEKPSGTWGIYGALGVTGREMMEICLPGVNYMFTPHWGIGADINFSSTMDYWNRAQPTKDAGIYAQSYNLDESYLQFRTQLIYGTGFFNIRSIGVSFNLLAGITFASDKASVEYARLDAPIDNLDSIDLWDLPEGTHWTESKSQFCINPHCGIELRLDVDNRKCDYIFIRYEIGSYDCYKVLRTMPHGVNCPKRSPSHSISVLGYCYTLPSRRLRRSR